MSKKRMDELSGQLKSLCLTPGLSGHEQRVRAVLKNSLGELGLQAATDVLGNLSVTLPGDEKLPSVLLFAHMDQLGFVVSSVEANGMLRLARLGGVPERALAAQQMVVTTNTGEDLPGVIGNKSHHVTSPEEKYQVAKCADLELDIGFSDDRQVRKAGIDIGSPVVYAPSYTRMGNSCAAGTAVDDRAGCVTVVQVAKALRKKARRPTVHLAFSVQEEFNLRGIVPLARQLDPAIALQVDLMVSTDTAATAGLGQMNLGDGPAISLYSFHGRGTLNGVIPHPALVDLFCDKAAKLGTALQRSARVGVLTDLSYVQSLGAGVACLDVGFPMRYSHSAREVCDLRDVDGLINLLVAAIGGVADKGFTLARD